MKHGLSILFTAMMILTAHFPAAAEDVSYARVVWNHIPANVVYANTASPSLRVTPALAKRGPGSSESFTSMVGRLKPTAAITGTFFCTRSLQPTGDIVIEGKRVHSGCVGTALCVTEDGRVEFRSLREGRDTRWQGYQAVICGGPTLVRDGKPALSPRSEGFKDPGLFGRRRRVAVGLTSAEKLLMVTTDAAVSLGDLARLMVHLGATDAIDLDGGTSTALYYRGKVVSRPGRSLTNLLVVYETPTQYAQYRSQLAPDMPHPVVAAAPHRPSATVLSADDPLFNALLTSAARPAGSRTIRWNFHDQWMDRDSDTQVISAKPSSID